MRASNIFNDAYPYERNSRWCSTEPSLIMNHQKNEDGSLTNGTDTLFWNKDALPVSTVMVGNKYYVVLLRTERHQDLPDILFSGTWEYQFNKLLLHIEQDNLMGGKYESIVLAPTGEWL